jgi:hypothetical protein
MSTVDPHLYDQLNKGWKSTCKVLLGGEIGELKEYEKWLKRYCPAPGKRTSHISGKEVTLAIDDYCKGANFISLDEVSEGALDPLTINEVKDIDSIVDAISEKWEYTGNKILGNSKFVDLSDNIIDSQYVLGSAHIQKSHNIYASNFVTADSKYIFGGNWVTNCEFFVRSTGMSSTRCFGANFLEDCSDLYLCYMCMGCHDLLFCLNQKNKRNCIGNLQLPKDKYLDLKKKLIAEIRDELRQTKNFPSTFELSELKEVKADTKLSIVPEKTEEDMVPVEKAFTSTFKTLFKKDAKNILDYEDWLSGHFPKIKEVTSPFGYRVYDANWSLVTLYSEKRTVSRKEAEELGKRHLDESDIGSLERIKERMPDIGYFTSEYLYGRSINSIKSPMVSNSSNIYKVADANYSDYSGVDFTIIYSKHTFGSHRTIETQFSMKCYNSLNLNRCFEMDSCTKCSDTYFSHNCEGLTDAMFCFNTKGKRCAIGNALLEPERYRKIKDMLVEQMAGDIVKNKSLKYNIYNIGCGRQK